MAARRGGRGSRVGTFFVLLGILGVLSGTFVAGFWTGHNWPVLWGGAKVPASEPGKRGVAERPKPAEALPALTFYDELRAPLTAPPPPPVRGKVKPPEVARRETVPETAPPPALTPIETTLARPEPPVTAPRVEPAAPAAPASPAVHAEPPGPAADDGGSRFTVQVAAYNVRTQADALRATLAAGGHDARVVEAVTPAGVRYRVQVGAFATRQAAQEASARLAAERSTATFVTTR